MPFEPMTFEDYLAKHMKDPEFAKAYRKANRYHVITGPYWHVVNRIRRLIRKIKDRLCPTSDQ